MLLSLVHIMAYLKDGILHDTFWLMDETSEGGWPGWGWVSSVVSSSPVALGPKGITVSAHLGISLQLLISSTISWYWKDQICFFLFLPLCVVFSILVFTFVLLHVLMLLLLIYQLWTISFDFRRLQIQNSRYLLLLFIIIPPTSPSLFLPIFHFLKKSFLLYWDTGVP